MQNNRIPPPVFHFNLAISLMMMYCMGYRLYGKHHKLFMFSLNYVAPKIFMRHFYFHTFHSTMKILSHLANILSWGLGAVFDKSE